MSVGIVGYGSFGKFTELLVRRFAPYAEVRVHSSRFEPDGKTFFSLAAAAQCDAVILCVPIHVYEQQLTDILPLLGGKSVLVDVATVKLHTVQLLRRLAAGRRYVASHPMFGPESYSKREGEVKGFRIVITEHTLRDDEYASIARFLGDCGFSLIEMTPEDHDKHLAETLFLTHFIGQSVAHAGFDRTPIDTVSFGFLMDAVESVRHDLNLFRDVYRFNPYCEAMLQKLELSQDEVRKLLEKGSLKELARNADFS